MLEPILFPLRFELLTRHFTYILECILDFAYLLLLSEAEDDLLVCLYFALLLYDFLGDFTLWFEDVFLNRLRINH